MPLAVATPHVTVPSGPPRFNNAVRVWAVLRLTRPWFWPLGWAGAAFGAVLATGDWLPVRGDVPATIAVGLVLGPLVWTFVFALNDLHDLPSDRHNPRKS